MWRRLPACCVLALACAARPSGEDEGAVTTNAGESAPESESDSGPSTASTTSTSTSTSTDDTTGDGDTTDDTNGDGDGDCEPGGKLDLPPDPDPPLPDSCTTSPVEWFDLPEFPGCTLCEDVGIGCIHRLYLACVDPEPGQTCAELCPSGNCAGFDWSICDGELGGWGDEPSDWCGHYEIDGRCCTLGKILWACAE